MMEENWTSQGCLKRDENKKKNEDETTSFRALLKFKIKQIEIRGEADGGHNHTLMLKQDFGQ